MKKSDEKRVIDTGEGSISGRNCGRKIVRRRASGGKERRGEK